MIGRLSGKYESAEEGWPYGNPGCVSDGEGDGGGVSYGVWQLSSTKGSAAKFVRWLCDSEREAWRMFGAKLGAHTPGTPDFSDVWRWAAEQLPDEFWAAQAKYCMGVYYEEGARELLDRFGFDISSRSNALKEVLFSNCIQHGDYGPDFFGDAALRAGKDLNAMTDREIIEIGFECKLTDPAWSSGSPDQRYGLYRRWREERADALAMLEGEEEGV